MENQIQNTLSKSARPLFRSSNLEFITSPHSECLVSSGMCYGRIGSNFLSLNPCAKPLKSYGVLNRCCSGVWTIMNMIVWQRFLRENKRNVQSHFACPVLLMTLILPWAQQVSANTNKQVFQVKYLCFTQTHTNAVNDNTQLNISFWGWLNLPNAQVVGKWRNWSIL